MRRVMLIVNPRSGSASPRTTEVIAKALAADFKLERADTTARLHAAELAADAVDRGFEAVIAFGGDGTMNEAAQALVGTDVALGMLPGGTANVMARSTGVPPDPIAATAYVSSHLRSGTRRRIPVGQIEDRYFLFSAGMGLDAEVVRRTEEHPEGKAKWREWSFLAKALNAAFTQYRGMEPQITLEVEDEEPQRLLLAICCNARPLTYFKRWPVDACPLARLDGGLDIFGMKRVRTLTIPRIAWGVLVSRNHINWRSGYYRHDLQGARLSADTPMPVQVDGDYLGEWTGAEINLLPNALDLLV